MVDHYMCLHSLGMWREPQWLEWAEGFISQARRQQALNVVASLRRVKSWGTGQGAQCLDVEGRLRLFWCVVQYLQHAASMQHGSMASAPRRTYMYQVGLLGRYYHLEPPRTAPGWTRLDTAGPQPPQTTSVLLMGQPPRRPSTREGQRSLAVLSRCLIVGVQCNCSISRYPRSTASRTPWPPRPRIIIAH